MFESLENRLLMRGGVISLNAHHTLTVSGTAGNDVIDVGGTPQHMVVVLNGKRQTFSFQHVHRVIVWAGAGDDVVDGGAGGNALKDLDVPANIDGGAGNDRLFGGVKADTLLGGSGRDRLFGSPSGVLDYLDGGSGNDRLFDGGTMNGGSGTDVATAFGTNALVSGIETFYTTDDSPRPGPVSDVVDRARYRGDLTTQGSQLVFRHPTYTGYHYTLSGPTVRADGMLQITLTSQDAASDYQPTEPQLVVKLDRADAVKRGVVFVDDTNGGTEQTVLLPST